MSVTVHTVAESVEIRVANVPCRVVSYDKPYGAFCINPCLLLEDANGLWYKVFIDGDTYDICHCMFGGLTPAGTGNANALLNVLHLL